MTVDNPAMTYITAGEYISELMVKYQPFGAKRETALQQADVLGSCLERLAQGELVAWSKNWHFSKGLDADPESSFDEWKVPDPYFLDSSDGKFSAIPREFWEHFTECLGCNRKFDMVFNSFALFRCRPGILTGDRLDHIIKGKASDVHFSIDREIMPSHRLGTEPEEQAGSMGKVNGGGRPPANWWPDFAVELAVYIYEMGVPENGRGAQAAVIDAVFARMNEHGRPEATRTAVQPVVNEVLRRIYSSPD